MEDGKDMLNWIVDELRQNEKTFMELRKDPFDWLGAGDRTLDQMEDHTFCSLVTGSASDLTYCLAGLNGALDQGLT